MFEMIKMFLQLSHLLDGCQLRFLSFYLVCEVDVFKHLRFCDDFSHLVTTRFLAIAKLC